MDLNDPKQAIGCCCCVSFLVALAVIGFLSFASLDANEYGLDYSYITKNIDVKVYGPGYHFLGFGHSFLIYPSTVQNMEFSNEQKADRPPIQSRTDDGLMISFKASFQYRLYDNKLFDLYMKYGEDYTTPCQKYAIDILNDAATKYDANTFFSKTD